MQFLPEPLRPLADYSQFIVWRPEWNATKNKYEKLPTCPIMGGNVDHLNPSSWMDFATASRLATEQGLGVGFIITRRDPFFVVDIDSALQPDGSWSPLVNELYQAFAGAAFEVSHSGKGVHMFGVGQFPEKHRCRRDDLGLEFYTEGRFMAITGTSATGNAYTDCTAGINYLISKYLPPREINGVLGWTVEPAEEWDGPDDDAELIKRMFKAKPSSAVTFGSRASPKALWDADADELSKFFPSKTGDVYDRSAADAALCQHLAFWTGKNCDRIVRLFEQSGLMRDKWASRPGYQYDTTTTAAAWCKDVYKQRRKVENPEPAPYVHSEEIPEGVIREGFQYLGLPQQLEHFKHCVYVRHQHAIKIPNGRLVKSEQFKADFGGYWFAMDSIGDKSSKNAWEVFTESQGVRFARADMTCFRPELPVSAIIDDDGVTRVNTYVPINVRRVQGDPSPILRHMAKLLPVPSDQAILLAYMAACVQFKGTKFRWCPLIQGVPGNGKSTLSMVVARAIGMGHTHSPAAADIANKFNDWLEDKLFIYVNDIFTADKLEVTEFLKPIISEMYAEVQPKGGAKYMADNRANLMLNSNFKDGLRKTLDDRRIAPFFTAQQTKADMERDGMDDRYFGELRAWLDADGYAIMADYLHNYPIPYALDPRNHSTCPQTSSTFDAIEAGLGSVEQEVMEAIGQGRQGFAGGWVSSSALERLLEQKGLNKRVPPNKRRSLLESLGFIAHPHLLDGRTAGVVVIDGGTKPRLYIKEGHISCQLTGSKAIVDAYTKAQEAGGVNEITTAIFGQTS